MSQQRYFIKRALLGDGWSNNVLLSVDNSGLISDVTLGADANSGDNTLGMVIPGMINCHSHSFQRAIAGLTECRLSAADTFWSWRKTMYQFTDSIGPENLAAISAYLYIEMLKKGYTSVAEFHYLHHSPNGEHYSSISELSQSIVNAANTAGINLTLLPTLYMTSGFSAEGLMGQQKRFGNTVDSYLRLHQQAERYCANYPQHQLGLAVHSLRAAPKEAIDELLGHFSASHKSIPIHLHIAEQIQEVEQSIIALSQRPIEWLLENYCVDKRWCLVHATHMTESETIALAKSGATVGLCPSTEANLADGFFSLRSYLEHRGHIAIGSDGNTCTNPMEEMRLLEYGQRLLSRIRNVAADDEQLHTGSCLFEHCLKGGARSIGQNTGLIAKGYRADLVVLDDHAAELCNISSDFIMDTLLFAPNQALVKSVMVNGSWQIIDCHHAEELVIKERFIAAIKAIRN